MKIDYMTIRCFFYGINVCFFSGIHSLCAVNENISPSHLVDVSFSTNKNDGDVKSERVDVKKDVISPEKQGVGQAAAVSVVDSSSNLATNAVNFASKATQKNKEEEAGAVQNHILQLLNQNDSSGTK